MDSASSQPSGSLVRLLLDRWILLSICFWVVLLVYWIGSVIFTLYFHPLSKYPGPRFWAASRLPYCYYLIKGRLPQTIKVLHDKYGKIIRVAPDELSFIDGRAWKDINQPKPGNGPYDKWGAYLNKSVNGTYSVLTAPTFAEHARIKRPVAHGFSDRALRAQEEMFQGHVNVLISRMRNAIVSGQQSFDMFQWYTWSTSDIMGDLAFGEDFGCLQNGKNHDWISILFKQFHAVVTLTCLRMFPVTRKLLELYRPEAIMKRPRELIKYAADKIDQRLGLHTERPDFLHYIQREGKNNEVLSRAEIDNTMATLIIAGGETTAEFLSGVTFYLVQNPEALHKVEEELRLAFKSEDEINATSTMKLPYFEAVVKEGLRLCPAVPFGHPRVVPNGGGEICGQWIPEGTKLTLMAWATYMSEQNFKDADKFIPERWLEYNGYDDRVAFEPFSLGPRNCIGKNLALVELRIILARVLYNFDLSVPAGMSDLGWKWGDQQIFMLWQCDPMVVDVKEARPLDEKR